MIEEKESRNVGADGIWPLPVVIMAGGKGTRLRPFTNSIPKALVEVNGTPIIDRIIEQFRTWGCEEFWATVDYHAEKLEEHFANINPDRRARLVNTDGHWGTAAPLKVLQGLVDPPFVLSNNDVLVDADYPAIAREGAGRGDALTLIAYRHRRVIPAGAVELAADGGFRGFAPRREIEELIYSGVCIVGPGALPLVGDDNPLDLPELVLRCREAGLRVGVETVDEDAFLDMGTFGALARMSEALKKVEGDRSATG